MSRTASLGVSALLALALVGGATSAAAAPARAPEPLPAQASPAAVTKRFKPAPVLVQRKDVPLPERRPGMQYAVSGDGTRSSVVAAPPPGNPRSKWEVSYSSGFYTGVGVDARAAFQAAVDTWARIVSSTVPIKVEATFAPLQGAVLGAASPTWFYEVGSTGTLYPAALADETRGQHVEPGEFDISAEFNSDPSAGFYYGTDGAPGADQVDFRTVVLHELGHGLGIGGSMWVEDGVGMYGLGDFGQEQPIVYDRYAYDAPTGGALLLSRQNYSSSLRDALQGGSVYWGGSRAAAAAGARPELYAPSAWEPGSSYSHLDEDAFPPGTPQSLMTPFVSANEVVHSPGAIAVAMLADQGWTASLPTGAPPGVATNLQVVPGDMQVRISWSPAPGNGTDVSSYTVTADPGGATCTTSGLACTVAGLTNGVTYTFTATATSAAGTGQASSPSPTAVPEPDDTAPTASIATPREFSRATASFSFTGSDPGRPGALLSFTCQVDSGSPVPCTSPWTTPAQTAGPHTFTLVASDEKGNASPPVSSTWTVDLAAPTASVRGLVKLTLGASAPLVYSGTDTGGSGVASYDIHYRRAAYNAALPTGWTALKTGLTTTSYSAPLAPGYRYCFRVLARDRAGNQGAPSPEVCTASALDDRSLVASTYWTRPGNASTYYAGTYSTAARTGETLTRTGVRTKSLSLFATTCPTCGSVGVYWNGRLLKTVSLASSTTATKQVFHITTSLSPSQAGTLVIKTLSAKRVHIDGVGLSLA